MALFNPRDPEPSLGDWVMRRFDASRLPPGVLPTGVYPSGPEGDPFFTGPRVPEPEPSPFLSPGEFPPLDSEAKKPPTPKTADDAWRLASHETDSLIDPMGVNPSIHPAKPAAQSGASSGSHIRYQDPRTGKWVDYGGDQASSDAAWAAFHSGGPSGGPPEPRRGGLVTADMNALGPQQRQDLDQARIDQEIARRTLEDPMWAERAKAQADFNAKAGLESYKTQIQQQQENQRQQAFMAQSNDLEDAYQRKVAEIKKDPTLNELQRQKKIDEKTAIRDEQIQRLRESFQIGEKMGTLSYRGGGGF